ncbi:flagellar assembly protein FliH [Jatrophihabitans endophyticus]|uniref:Flagellar assembly protein FliH n=1 Tax=Jatrophihabitans endophyticus TaxID=1206085 RepID=A0A1M5IGB5_9ACTN|nr:FliH/SctL family protein [Jatrophihabitans endophyticus]SHG26990.1 flagellar assembly protein FliH [Jatrophihabitans endophyticus]
MPSSPDTAVSVPTPAATPELVRWEPVELTATAPAVSGAGRARTAAWSFEEAFPPAPVAAPEPFAVSPRSGIPDAVLADARKAAQSAGYAEGFASGVAEARFRAEADATAEHARAERAAVQARIAVERATSALVAASTELAGRTAVTLADVESLVVSAAYDVAEAVVGAVVRHDPQRGANAITRALALVPDGATDVSVALNPTDLATIDASGSFAGVRLVADASLAPGDAIAVGDATTVDARIAAGLARVREVLGR